MHLTARIVVAYVNENQVPMDEVPMVLTSVLETMRALSNERMGRAASSVPAVSIKKSITPDYLICLEDGRKVTMLRRYLLTRYELTPDQYRSKWGLPADYPMISPNYSARRSELAKKNGLGRVSGIKRKRKAG